ncbi:MAG: ribonuclease HIII [Parachlamydiales bacterium]|nr:ribonuclease HIII [Parachlamydiales bacterium]
MRDLPPSFPRCYVINIEPGCVEKLRTDLESQGFEFTVPPHTIFSAKKKGISCTLYQSGKLTVQGKEMAEFIEFYLEPEIIFQSAFNNPPAKLNLTPRIGVDESGKGDFFGPLCAAGIYVDESQMQLLVDIGVKDSKLLSEKAIEKIAAQLREKFAYHVVCINPKRYNELYEQFKNLNTLLGWAHAAVIGQLVEKTGCDEVIIDQFAAEYVVIQALKRRGVVVKLTQRHRAEEDLVVAAASILARSSFVQQLSKLSKEFHCELPKGASAGTIKVGKELVQRYGSEVLNQVGKMHFKTAQMILGNPKRPFNQRDPDELPFDDVS